MLRLVSDVHTEFMQPAKAIAAAAHWAPEGADVLVLAGDIGKVLNKHGTLNQTLVAVLATAVSKWKGKAVVYTPGNHEYYGAAEHGMAPEDVDALLEEWCRLHGVVFLQKRVWDMPDTDITFVGCTLWADATDGALAGINDIQRALAGTEVYRRLHTEHRRWLQGALADLQGSGRRVVVVSHHLPSYACIHPSHAGDGELNSAYATNMPLRLFKAPVCLWLHGHSHELTDVQVGTVRVVNNPTGYPGERRETKTSTELFAVSE